MKLKIFLATSIVVLISAFLLSAYAQVTRPGQTTRQPAWEYKVMNVVHQNNKVYIFEDGTRLNLPGELRRINELGSQGWELVSNNAVLDAFSADPNLMGTMANIHTFWFKRPK